MVKIDDGKRQDAPVTNRLFLNSIKKWYNDTGIHVCINSISPVKESDKAGQGVLAVNFEPVEDMEKCFARVIGDNGKAVTIEDEFGEEKEKIEVISNPDEITAWLKVKIENEENEEYKLFNLASAYPLVNFAFIESGDLPADNNKNIVFSYDELVEALEGLEFKCFTETRNYKGGNKYQVIIPKSL